MIHWAQSNGITKILIDNDCNKEDTDKLLELIEEQNRLEISFISVSILSSKIIKALSYYHKKLELSTDDKSLWRYLRKISIDISLENAYNKTNQINTPLKAIAIGGSAGALENIIKILKELPYADITVFIVEHILPDEKNRLADILQQFTSYKVKEADHGELIKSNHIYVASANLHMVVEGGYIYQSKTQRVNFCRPSIDMLFKSLALEYKSSLLVILTCGYMDDGASSLKEIKKNGAVSIIQNPNECEANEIPLNAIMTKNYNHVFGIEQINEYIKSKLNTIIDLDERINKLIYNIYKVYGYDFRDYDKRSVTRRVELLRGELGIDTFSEFEELILNDVDTFELFFKKLSINVSEFFRDTEVFKQIREKIVSILGTYPHIRIWCAGCSQGQEPYSIAILLDEMGLLKRSIIYATDFNNMVLQQAQNGIFSKDSYKLDKENYIKSGGKKDFDNWFDINDNYVEVNSYIKDKVHFFQHNLVTDGEINEFHLVFCRNVLIYFNENLQNKVLKLIYTSLIRDGFLILGKSETVNLKDGFIKFNENENNKIFQKIRDDG
ncbi:MAG: hypothetical protein KAQ94_01970 [Arcobacteraceae bacterium]|nr:hypothetical protein [Arcobacteraceae bacterium]